MTRLFRRREVLLPTAWGGLLLLLFVAAVSAMFLARNLHPFLAVTRPVGAKVLVVEGWIEPSGLDQAMVAFRASAATGTR